MEAPEKIYRTTTYLDNDKGKTLWKEAPVKGAENIEYTRTDAFIEKAKEWFIEHVNIPQDVETNEDGEPLADSYIKYAKARFDAANEIFENFKNYMEGE